MLIILNKKIIVTGANGQVGKAILSLSHLFPSTKLLAYPKDQFDITSDSDIEQYITKDISIVINAAAYTKVDQAEDEPEVCNRINHLAVEKLAKRTKHLGIPFIHLSSDYVYSPNHDRPIVESDSTNPKSVYAKSKLDGDLAALKENPKSIILRTSWVYDASGHNFVNTISRLGKTRDSLNIVNDQIGSPTYARNIGQAISIITSNILNKECEEYGIYHFSDEGFINWYQFAKEILRVQNIQCDLHPIPSSEYPTKAHRPFNSRLDKTKIETVFGIKAKNWQESLRECIKFKNSMANQ